MSKIVCFFIAILLVACQQSQTKINENNENSNNSLYSLRSYEDTGINFKNILKENNNLNGVLYEYLYNGGGVAVSDFNGDDLQDIYFISNLQSNKLYLNKGNLKFKDITNVSKVNGNKGFPTGVTVVDINADGKMDIYVCKSGKYSNPNDRVNELYVNTGNNKQGLPVFEEMSEKYGLNLPHFSTQAAFFDYDKDGDLDMFLINHGTKSYEDELTFNLLNTPIEFQSSRLFRNDNNFFTDVSDQSGIINNALSFGLGLAIGDLNNDNWPDVLVGHDFSEKDHLYLNQKNGTFKEVIEEATNHISYFSMGNDISDFNNDGWLDFITVDMMSEHNYDIKTSMSGMNPERFYELTDMGLHYQYMYNTAQVNNGVMNSENSIPAFSDIAQMNGISSTDWSWSPLVFDMDNDGWKDIFVSNGIKRDFRNNDFIRYKKSKFDEFFKTHPEKNRQNKQLARDLIMELIDEMPTRNKPNYFFQNQAGKGFVKKNNSWIKDYPTSSNGAAYADLDNDGDLDIVINNTDDFAMIYENNASQLNTGNYLSIKLKGKDKNPNAIGTRITLYQKGNKQIQENYLTRGFQSAASGNLHFGIGNQDTIDKIIVQWSDGKTSALKNIDANQTLIIDYNLAKDEIFQTEKNIPLFNDITKKTKLNHLDEENDFNDFERESLLPHKMSQLGPALAKTDLNGDNLDDIFVGGSHGSRGKLYMQNDNGTFTEKKDTPFDLDKKHEDVSALFFDADNDGDEDLYVVSGSNEYKIGSEYLKDRLYKNNGNGNFDLVDALPFLGISGSIVKAADFDLDGDLDLFIGGRQKPGHYPEPVSSILLQNNSESGKILFTDITKNTAKPLINIGMVTDAVWLDINNDTWMDLMIIGEWMSPVLLKNNKGTFENISSNSGLSEETGWWFSLSSGDFDGDGDQDLVAGNLGLNYKYKASKAAPFEIYQNDFDDNGKLDIVLGYYDLGTLYPLRGRQCSSNQVPEIKEKFKNYHSYAEATLIDVYGDDNLNKAVHYKATNFTTSYFENMGNGKFQTRSLNRMAQISSVNAINIDDFDKDGHLDIILSGNWYVSEVETPRNDASFGVLLKGDGNGRFKEITAIESGLYIKGDVRNAEVINISGGKQALVISKNNDYMQVYEISK
jgi:hypothetical protein